MMIARRFAAAALLMTVVAACDETPAEPEPGQAFLRWGNAIPGGPTVDAILNGKVVGTLGPGESIRDTLAAGAQSAGMVSETVAASATLQLPVERPVVLLLVDGDSPRLFSVTSREPAPEGAGFVLLNVTPEGPLTVRVVSDGDGSVGGEVASFAQGGGRSQFSVGGTFDVWVHDGDAANEVMVGTVDGVVGEWTFVTIVPGAGQRWEVMAF